MRPPLLLDSNLCVLWVAGTAEPRAVGHHKRLRAYELSDFNALIAIIAAAPRVILCPHVLAETSNLVLQVDGKWKHVIARIFAEIVERFGEQPASSLNALKRPEYERLGLTDAVLLALNETGASLLTADLGLYLAAQAAGYQVTNFVHLREQGFIQ